MTYENAQQRWIREGCIVPDDWPRIIPCAAIPSWGKTHDDGIRPAPCAPGRKKLVPSLHYRNLVTAFAESDAYCAEIAFDHTTHTANGVRSVLASQQCPGYPTIRVVQRGGRVFIEKPSERPLVRDTPPPLLVIRRAAGETEPWRG